MILESIVSSVDRNGEINLAPMGPRLDWDLARQNALGKSILLRPFQSSKTYQNLKHVGKAVVHVTDDADLFARTAVNSLDQDDLIQRLNRIDETDWWTLRDCHRWMAVEVESVRDIEPRAEMRCRVRRTEVVRPFFGFNRAKHAVIEAAILATRTHLIDREELQQQLRWLQPLVEKTGGDMERRAFEFLKQTIDERCGG